MKHILFQLLFLLAILFCLGLEVYTNNNTQGCNTELSSKQDGEENIVFANIDFIEDENFTSDYEITPFVEQLLLIPISNELFLLKEYPFSSWQPPKLA